MGVKGASRLKKKYQLAVDTFTQHEMARILDGERVYVDVFGAFYTLVKSYLYKNKVVQLASFFKNSFSYENTIFVFDGNRTIEKSTTHAERDRKRTSRLSNLELLIKTMEEKVQDQYLTRISKAKWKKVENGLLKDYVPQKDLVEELVESMESLGLSCVIAKGEADVYIASCQDCSIAISNDSDLIFHRNIQMCASVKVVGRLLQFTTYPKEVIVERLRLENLGTHV